MSQSRDFQIQQISEEKLSQIKEDCYEQTRPYGFIMAAFAGATLGHAVSGNPVALPFAGMTGLSCMLFNSEYKRCMSKKIKEEFRENEKTQQLKI